ncbi:MAG: DUF1501 domain-containing protein [Betaproteobacteria bacterium]|nr:DUF1501 domain-containing protein [Betaproteobacteria bacterium]
MNRRHFLQTLGAAASVPLAGTFNGVSWAAPAPSATIGNTPYNNLLILIELKGANDGLNTVVPFANPAYATLRPRIAIARDQVLQLSEQEGLHPSLKPLMALWENKELAVVQGLGYPNPNLSHFRSIEIWDTASKSEEYLDAGWLARAFAAAPAPRQFAADGVVVGSSDMGPLSGQGVRTIALADTAQFLRNARLAQAGGDQRNAALKHILSVEQEILHAAGKLNTNFAFKTEFPRNGFGNQVRTAAQLVASKAGIATIRLTHTGFDTHANQLGTHANLLKDLAEGIAALKSAMQELNRWDSTLVMTYAEFGRRPKENQSSGTDHGTASVHFVTGGKVKGGLYGEGPQLARLDGNGNLPFAVDFRSMYATVIDKWWQGDSAKVLGGKFAALDWLKA